MTRRLMAITFAFLCAGFSAVAYASPFLVSDPNPSAVGGYSDITGAPWLASPQTPLQADGSVRVDFAAAPVGSSSLQVRVCKEDATWGTLCSDTVPFAFTRPGPPSAGGGLRLVK